MKDMKSHRIIAGFLSVSVIAVSTLCSQLKGATAVEEVLTIGLQQHHELYSIGGIAIDIERNIYVSDVMEYSIKKFDVRGNLIGRAGRKGSGPGEFKSPATCVLWKDTLAVMQMNDPLLQMFSSRDLHYLKSVRATAGLPMDITFDNGGKLYVAVFGESPRPSVLVFEKSLATHQRQIMLSATGMQNMLYGACKIAVGIRDELVVAYTFMNRIDVCNGDGKVVRSFAIPGVKRLSADHSGISLPEETFTKSVTLDRKGCIWLLGGSMYPHESRDVYVLSPDGAFLYSFELPHKSRTIVLDRDGFLYGTAEEGTLLKKYKLLRRSPN
jgi:hypothetical protein